MSKGALRFSSLSSNALARLMLPTVGLLFESLIGFWDFYGVSGMKATLTSAGKVAW